MSRMRLSFAPWRLGVVGSYWFLAVVSLSLYAWLYFAPQSTVAISDRSLSAVWLIALTTVSSIFLTVKSAWVSLASLGLFLLGFLCSLTEYNATAWYACAVGIVLSMASLGGPRERSLGCFDLCFLSLLFWFEVTVIGLEGLSGEPLSSQAEQRVVFQALAISVFVLKLLFGKTIQNTHSFRGFNEACLSKKGSFLYWLGFYFVCLSISVLVIRSIFPSISFDGVVFWLSGAVFTGIVFHNKFYGPLKILFQKNFRKPLFDYRASWLCTIDALANATSPLDACKVGLSCLKKGLQATDVSLFKWDNSVSVCEGSSELNLPEEALSSLSLLKNYVTEHVWVIDLFELQTSPYHYPAGAPELPYRWPRGWYLVPVEMSDKVPAFLLVKNSKILLSGINWETKDFALVMTKQVWHHYIAECNRQKLTEQAQFIAFYQTSAFVIHDLKNIDAQLGMIIDNSVDYGDDLEFAQGVYKTIGSIQQRLNKTLSQLRAKLSEQKSNEISVSEWLKLIKSKSSGKGVAFSFVGEVDWLEQYPSGLLRVISHLVDNAIEAMEKSPVPFLEVILERGEFDLFILVRDNGCGMSDEFIKDGLFKPFRTTKGNAGMGLGVFEAKQYVLSLGGKVYIESVLNKGTSFHIALPTKSSGQSAE